MCMGRDASMHARIKRGVRRLRPARPTDRDCRGRPAGHACVYCRQPAHHLVTPSEVRFSHTTSAQSSCTA